VTGVRSLPPRLAALLAERILLGVAGSMAPVALTFTVLDVLHRAADLGMVLGAEGAGLLLGLLGMAGLADRISPRTLLVAADLLLALPLAVPAFAGLAHLRALAWYVLPALVAGLSTAVVVPALQALIARVVPTESRQSVNAMRSVARNLASIAGPALAGLVAVVASPEVALLLAAALAAIGAATVLAVPDPGRVAKETPAMLTELAAGWRAYLHERWLIAIDLWFAAWHLVVFGPLMVLGPVLALAHLGGSGSWAALLVALAIGGTIGGAAGLRLRIHHPLVVGTLAMCLTVGWLVALAMLAALWLQLGLAVLAGAGLEVFTLAFDTSLQANVAAEMLGKLAAYDFLASALFLPLGYALAVPMAHLVGDAGVFWLGVAVTVTGALAVLAVPSVRQLRDRGPGEVTSAA
jgi:MFS family permease